MDVATGPVADSNTHRARDEFRPRAVQAALRKTTEALAHELAQPTNITPQWSDFEWRVARAVAAMHGVSALLASRLGWRGPPGWEQFLAEQTAHTQARHVRVEELLQRIDAQARMTGIGAVALKGVELYALKLYAAGERPMADVDLLVKAKDFGRAARMLSSLDFHESFATRRHRVFMANGGGPHAGLGEHTDNPLKIELHERISESLPLKTADVTRWLQPSHLPAGLNGYPSKASLMSHLLLHAAGAMADRALRLLHLQDLALLSVSMTDEDWGELLQQSSCDRGHWWAFPPLQLTARYFPGAIPTRSLVSLAAQCPRLLRSLARRRVLSDVSLSHLWIIAFPRVEWSQSPLESLRYVVSRVRPNAGMREQRRQLARTQVAATAWQHLSQSRRLARWLTSRSDRMRADTEHAVRLTLTQAP